MKEVDFKGFQPVIDYTKVHSTCQSTVDCKDCSFLQLCLDFSVNEVDSNE